jgi:oxygen-independent coproporphyrinogen-3 oxidase
MLGVETVRAYIEKHRGRRQSNKVLHGHPSPVFWLEHEVSVPSVMATRARARRDVRKRVNLYVGTPYCLPTEPDRCGFCLFPSEIYRSRQQLDEYLTYLRREGAMFRPYFEGDALASIYFGGGTSNLYKADQYAVLMDIVRSVFPVPPHLEVTLEGIPQTFTRDKLVAMKACGITRISMGVQQLDDDMIRLSGRKQTAEQVFQTIEWCHELGLPISVDLIFGWPTQTTDRMLKDLEAIVATGITHITHYELNVAGRTDFSRHHRDELPSTEQNLEMYRVGKAFLESHAYRQATPYDFEKPSGSVPASYLYEEIFRRPFREQDGNLIGFDAWGWGYAGISFFFGTPQSPGWAYLNHVHVEEYFAAIEKRAFPVMRGFHYTEDDLRLHLLFQEMQGLSVDRLGYARLFGRDVVEEHRPIWRVLEELAWAKISDDRIALLGEGVFYLPMIQNLLSHERIDQMRKGRAATADVLSYTPLQSLKAVS